MTKIRLLLISGTMMVLSSQTRLAAQSTNLPVRSHGTWLTERFDILYPGQNSVHSDLRGYFRKDAANWANWADTTTVALSEQEKADIQYLADDNNDWTNRVSEPRKRWLYKTPAFLYEVNTPDFKLRVNPLLNGQVGFESNRDEMLYINTRGFEVRGSIDDRVYFHTNLEETQLRYPDYVDQYIRDYKVPGAGFTKNYSGDPFGLAQGYDFNIANAYLGVKISKHIGLQLGHGSHFIGNGYRSMFLSDNSAPQFYLKLDTRLWKFHYQNLFMELTSLTSTDTTPGDSRLGRKYAAIHYLSYKVNPRLTFGFFESTIFNRTNDFEFQYLNPVILYRTVEGMIGSPDNAMLGMNVSWTALKGVQLYGQFLLDELRFSEFFGGNGWWGNKYSVQAGFKYLNVLGIQRLDLQGEFNSVRPYTYSHFNIENSYTHYNQPLAHPFGANFREMVGIVRYRPSSRLFFTARLIHALKGDNLPGENWGSNPLLTYNTREQEYGNEIGQGNRSTIFLAGLDISWMCFHNAFLDLKLLSRTREGADASTNQTTRVISAGFRVNLWPVNNDF